MDREIERAKEINRAIRIACAGLEGAIYRSASPRPIKYEILAGAEILALPVPPLPLGAID